MRTIIIDDEQQIRDGLKILLNPYAYLTIIGEASTITDGKTLIDTQKPDLVLLDIKLKEATGFALLDQITFKDFKLIFITAFNEYAIKAFKYNAFDYLLKPIDPDELETTLSRLNAEKTNFKNQQDLLNTNKNLDRLVVKTTEQIYVLQTDEIVRCQADQGYTIFYLKNNTRVISSKTLKEYNSLLPENQFLRVHQSHLVNSRFIKKYLRSGFLELLNNEQIPVSTRKRQEISERLTKL